MSWLLLTLILSMHGSTTKLSTNSATDNLNTAHYYNHNFYVIDKCRIWQHSTDFNKADYVADITTDTSDPFPLPTIYPLSTLNPRHNTHTSTTSLLIPFIANFQYTSTYHKVPFASRFSPITLSSSIMPILP